MSKTDFYTAQLKQFVGATVMGVTVDQDNEFFGLILLSPLSGGKTKIVWFLSDDEGNGPGSFEVQDME